MLLLRVAVAAALVQVCIGACVCSYPTQLYNANSWAHAYIMNAFDNGNACIMNCSMFIDSGDLTKGWTHFEISIFDQVEPGKTWIDVYNADGSVLIPHITDVSGPGAAVYNYVSTSSTVNITITQIGTKPVNILGTMEPATGLNVVTPRPSTTAPTTTVAYTGPLNANPKTISLDLMVALDSGAGSGDPAAFQSMKTILTNLISQLSISKLNATTAPDGQSRISLTTLNPLNTYQANGQPWALDLGAFTQTLNSLPQFQVGLSPYKTALTSMLNPTSSPFSVANDQTAFQNSRPWAQRVLLITTSALPSDIDAINATSVIANMLSALDVHVIVLGYGIADGTKFTNLGWSFYRITDTQPTSVNNFINAMLLNGDNVCSSDVTKPFDMSTADANHAHFDEPAHGAYLGPEAHDGPTAWPQTGQAGRYCNFQNRRYDFIQIPGKPIYFTVYYELEVEKDYLRFYENVGGASTEVVSLTGRDVSGATFTINGNATVEFSTNAAVVLGGFSLHAANTPTA